MSDPIDLIRAERERQVSEEGWTPQHDDEHYTGALGDAAAAYALDPRRRVRGRGGIRLDMAEVLWPWDAAWWKPTPDDRIRELVKAGALIVAEIERLQRMEAAR